MDPSNLYKYNFLCLESTRQGRGRKASFAGAHIAVVDVECGRGTALRAASALKGLVGCVAGEQRSMMATLLHALGTYPS